MNRRLLTTVVTITVSFCWATASLDSILFNRPIPAEVVTPVMLVVVGFFMARRNGDDSNGNGR